jgi:DNA mismatch endonuclease (patch repair protein)
LRKALWKEGIRYRKNYKLIPGVPDIAITKYKIAVFCDGEFWHGKDWYTKPPKIRTNREFWVSKIERNIMRDNEVDKQLENMGWTVLRFWGKEIQKNTDACVQEIKEAILQSQVISYEARYAYKKEVGVLIAAEQEPEYDSG